MHNILDGTEIYLENLNNINTPFERLRFLKTLKRANFSLGLISDL